MEEGCNFQKCEISQCLLLIHHLVNSNFIWTCDEQFIIFSTLIIAWYIWLILFSSIPNSHYHQWQLTNDISLFPTTTFTCMKILCYPMLITRYYGWLLLLTKDCSTNPLLNCMLIKTTTIWETIECHIYRARIVQFVEHLLVSHYQPEKHNRFQIATPPMLVNKYVIEKGLAAMLAS